MINIVIWVGMVEWYVVRLKWVRILVAQKISDGICKYLPAISLFCVKSVLAFIVFNRIN